MAVQTSAGTTIGVSLTLPSTEDTESSTGYPSLTFALIGEVESIGEYGVEYNEVTFTSLGDRKVRKLKGSYNPGTVSLTIALDGSDAGQGDVQTALDQDEDVAFAVTLQDGSIEYFSGKVMSFTTNVSSVDSITMGTVSIGINTDIVAA